MPRKDSDSYWFKFYPDKYLGGTGGFTLEMHGAYLLMLIHQWGCGPFDESTARAKVGDIWGKISFKFVLTDQGFANAKMAEESNHKQELSIKRTNAVQERYKKGTSVPKKEHSSDSDSVSVSLSVSSLGSYKKGNTAKIADGKQGWYDSFSIYRGQCEMWFDLYHDDWKWIEEHKLFHPGVSIQKTLCKAFMDFWDTERGWEHCKEKYDNTKKLNWDAIIANVLNQKMNRVYFPRGSVDHESAEIERRREKEKVSNPTNG